MLRCPHCASEATFRVLETVLQISTVHPTGAHTCDVLDSHRLAVEGWEWVECDGCHTRMTEDEAKTAWLAAHHPAQAWGVPPDAYPLFHNEDHPQ